MIADIRPRRSAGQFKRKVQALAFKSYAKTLIAAGAILFLLGLLQGAAIQMFLNPRLALSAHLTAVQSGMALMIAGIIWPAIALNAALKKAAQWSIILGMYALWAGLTLSAATGASTALPIAGKGFHADQLVELGASALILGASAVMTLGWLLFVTGIIRSKET
ncbi:MAG: hypothetical protein ABI240_16350 [Sphingomonas sp.]